MTDRQEDMNSISKYIISCTLMMGFHHMTAQHIGEGGTPLNDGLRLVSRRVCNMESSTAVRLLLMLIALCISPVQSAQASDLVLFPEINVENVFDVNISQSTIYQQTPRAKARNGCDAVDYRGGIWNFNGSIMAAQKSVIREQEANDVTVTVSLAITRCHNKRKPPCEHSLVDTDNKFPPIPSVSDISGQVRHQEHGYSFVSSKRLFAKFSNEYDAIEGKKDWSVFNHE